MVMLTPLNGEIGDRLLAHDNEYKSIVSAWKGGNLSQEEATILTEGFVEKTINLLSRVDTSVRSKYEEMIAGKIFVGAQELRSQFMNACGRAPDPEFMKRVIQPTATAKKLLRDWSDTHHALERPTDNPPMDSFRIK